MGYIRDGYPVFSLAPFCRYKNQLLVTVISLGFVIFSVIFVMFAVTIIIMNQMLLYLYHNAEGFQHFENDFCAFTGQALT